MVCLVSLFETHVVLSRVCKAPPCVEDQTQRRLHHLCQIPFDQPPQLPPPFNETRAYRVLFILGTFLAILTAMCAPYLIIYLVSSPNPLADGTTASPTSLGLETLRGANQGAIQGSTLPLGDLPAGDQSVDGTRWPIIPSPVESTRSSIKTGSGRRTQTSAVHASCNNTASPRLQDGLLLSVADADPPAPPPSDGPDRNLDLKPTPTAESGAHQGVFSDPARAEQPFPSPATGARKTIIKSLYPQTGTIGQDRHGTSSVHSPLQPRLAPLDRASFAVTCHLATWFILVVAVGTDELQDPELDLRFMVQAFKSPKVHLASLFNDQATHISIQHELRQLYFQAQQRPGSRILIYLTGSGDPSGNMCLNGGATISAQDLQSWLAELYTNSTLPRPTLGVVFDICRITATRSDPNPDLAIIWSCSINQWAYAVEFGQNLPSSCFLVSLFLAAHDSRDEPMDFEHAFETRLAQQGALIRFIHDGEHKTCVRCATTSPCRLPSPQKSEYGQAARDTFIRLGDLIRAEFPHVAHEVHDEINKRMTYWKFLDAEPWYRSFKLWPWMQHLVQGFVTKRARGGTAPVVQAHQIRYSNREDSSLSPSSLIFFMP